MSITNRVKFYFKTKGKHNPSDNSYTEGYQYVYDWTSEPFCIYHCLPIRSKCGIECEGYAPHSQHDWGRCKNCKRELVYTGFVKVKMGNRYFIVKEEDYEQRTF